VFVHELCPALTDSAWPDGLAVTPARSANPIGLVLCSKERVGPAVRVPCEGG